MVTYLGIDLAWGERNRTGLAALDEKGRLTASTAVVTDDEIAEFITTQSGSVVIAAIDAPIVVPNATGRRRCESMLQAEFGAYNAGAHSTNRSHAWFNPPRAMHLAERFRWEVDPAVTPAAGASVAIEVYPHPAMVTLFDLSTVIRYKNKPGRTTDSRREAFDHLLNEMERVCNRTLQLAESQRWQEIRRAVAAASRPMHLGAVEDEVDAIFCAYLAWLWARRDPRMQVLGDVHEGYIVVPRPPLARPQRPVPATRSEDASVAVRVSARTRTRLVAKAEARSVSVDELIAQALDALDGHSVDPTLPR